MTIVSTIFFCLFFVIGAFCVCYETYKSSIERKMRMHTLRHIIDLSESIDMAMTNIAYELSRK